MKRRILSLALIFVLVLCLIPFTALASENAYVTIRIEGGGHGEKEGITGIGTILEHTAVPLADLDDTPTAYEAVSRALEIRELGPAVVAGSEAYYAPVSFDGVFPEEGYDWNFVCNDAGATAGIYTQEISGGDSIVLYLTADWDSGNYRKDPYYSFFARKSLSFQDYGVPYVEACLTLKRIIPADWTTTFSDLYEPVGGAEVTVTAPEDAGGSFLCDAATDANNGTLNFSCWAEGEYVISATKTVEGGNTISRPYCKITVTGAGASVSAYSIAADTALSALSISFPGTSVLDGLPYLGTEGMTVSSAVDSVTVSAGANAPEAAVSAAYQAAGEAAASAYTPGDDAALAVGENVFYFTVTNETDIQIYTLKITREAVVSRDISAEVAAVIDGVWPVTGDAPYSDWILAMHAAGFEVSGAQLDAYLAAVLKTADDFADSGTGSVGAVAKHAIALTCLGIDARQIPDPDGGRAIDLIAEIASYGGTLDPIYAAPYLLSLFSLDNYEVPSGAVHTKSALIDGILGAQDETSKLWASVDGTGMVLPALAPYYNAPAPVDGVDLSRCADITVAIDDALAALSAAQAADGGLGGRNSNTTSTVITGLNAVGVNPHTDSRFIKSGSTLITNLLSFRTSDNKLGYTSGASANTMACYQGFQALATYMNLTSGRNGNLYHFSAETTPYTAWPDARLLTGIAVTVPPAVTSYEYNKNETSFTPSTDGMIVTATYNADPSNTEPVPAADCAVSPIDRSVPGTKTVTVTYKGKTATFMVTVLDGGSSVPVTETVSVTVSGANGRIAGGRVVIEENATSVLDVLKTVLDQAGKAYVIRDGIYVASIDGLGEFDEGANSGWLYSVNGVPSTGSAAADYLLTDGDVVLWYYTLDFTRDSSSSNWSGSAVPAESSIGTVAPEAVVKNGTAAVSVTAVMLGDAVDAAREGDVSTIVISPEIAGEVFKVTVTIPKSAVQEIAGDTDAAVFIITPVGSVEIGNDALTAIVSQAHGTDIVFSVEIKTALDIDLPQEDLENSLIAAVSIVSGDDDISQFGGNSLQISLPAGSGHTDGETYKVIAVGADGSLEILWGRTVAADGKTAVSVTVAHLSVFVVTDEKETLFADVAGDAWYASAVRFVTDRGLFQGTSESLFSPDAEMSRAMLATVLYRVAGKPAVTSENGFSDVEDEFWYTDAVLWASGNGIVKGIGDGLFGTAKPVTRQETAVMLYRFAILQGCDVSKAADLSVYEDAADISGWASGAMAWANAEGLIGGGGDGRLDPRGVARRAQIAEILQRMIENMNECGKSGNSSETGG